MACILNVLLPDGTFGKRLLVRDFLALVPDASTDSADFCRTAAESLRAAGWRHFSFDVVEDKGVGDGEVPVADKSVALALVAVLSDISTDQQRELCDRICQLFVPNRTDLVNDAHYKRLAQVQPKIHLQ